MKKLLLKPGLFAGLALCAAFSAFLFAGADKEEKVQNSMPGYKWTKLTEHAQFNKSYNFQLLTQDNKLWAFHPDGNYYSTNGKDWIKSSLTNSIHNLAFLDYVQFNNAVLGLGHFEGNIEHYQLGTSITRTTDLMSWQTLAASSNLPNRFFYHPIVFNGRIWILGGSSAENVDHDDAWSSVDGVHWKKEAEHLAFGPGHGQHFLFLHNKLFMLDNNSVWTSGDAIHWELLNAHITNADYLGYTPVVFDDKIWLLGCNRNRQFSSDILVSSDGIHWKEQDAPWSPRGGIATTVFNGKLYMTGGKYGGFKEGTTETEFVYSNDVWVLEKI